MIQGDRVFLRHTSAGYAVSWWYCSFPADMNVAPGTTAVLTSVEAVGEADAGTGVASSGFARIWIDCEPRQA